MNRIWDRKVCGLAVAAALLGLAGLRLLQAPPPESGAGKTQARLKATGLNLPLYFIENHGQADARVGFYLQGRDTAVYFTAEGMLIALTEKEDGGGQARMTPARFESLALEERTPRRRWSVRQDFVDARPDLKPEGLRKTEAIVSYFKGKPEDWRSGLPTYGGVIYRDVWPGIDVVYEGRGGRLKSDFIVHPGADPARIRLAWRGAGSMYIAGRSAGNELWWYKKAGNQWLWAGYPGFAAGPLAAAPR